MNLSKGKFASIKELLSSLQDGFSVKSNPLSDSDLGGQICEYLLSQIGPSSAGFSIAALTSSTLKISFRIYENLKLVPSNESISSNQNNEKLLFRQNSHDLLKEVETSKDKQEPDNPYKIRMLQSDKHQPEEQCSMEISKLDEDVGQNRFTIADSIRTFPNMRGFTKETLSDPFLLKQSSARPSLSIQPLNVLIVDQNALSV